MMRICQQPHKVLLLGHEGGSSVFDKGIRRRVLGREVLSLANLEQTGKGRVYNVYTLTLESAILQNPKIGF
jgi:hypothetical protein